MLDAPPEITSTLLYTGPGATPLLDAANGWTQLAAQLRVSAADITSIAQSVPWTGPSASQMRQTIAEHTVWLHTTADNATTASAALNHAASAYQTAHAAITPPTVVHANRLHTAVLIATNLLGQNTAQIAALQAQYAAMWATNTVVMHTYAAQTAAATTQLQPFTPPPAASDPDWNIFDPSSQNATTGLSGFLNMISGGDTAFGQLLNANVVNSLFSSGFWYSALEGGISDITGFGFLTAFISQQSAMQDIITKAAPPIVNLPRIDTPTPAATTPTASVGNGGSIGQLRVPPGWAAPHQPPTATAPAPNGDGRREPLPIPLPLPNISGATRHQLEHRQPRYGDTPTTMPKHPYGG